MPDFLHPVFDTAFVFAATPITWLEMAAFALALATVVMNIRVNPWGWPLAIVSSLLYFGLFWKNRLYGDASLQIFFAVVALWGWWQWLRGTNADGTPLEVDTLSVRGRWVAALALLVAWPLTGFFLKTYTDTDVPWWDAFPTAASVLGQWLLGRKHIENWPVWLGVNGVSVALFAYKGLGLTAILYAIFIAMSVVGWRAWALLLKPQAAR